MTFKVGDLIRPISAFFKDNHGDWYYGSKEPRVGFIFSHDKAISRAIMSNLIGEVIGIDGTWLLIWWLQLPGYNRESYDYFQYANAF